MTALWTVDLGYDGAQPNCLCVTSQAVWWVSAAGVLYTWRGGGVGVGNTDEAEVPDPVAMGQLDCRPLLLCVSPDSRSLLVLTAAYASLFGLQCETVPPFLCHSEQESDVDDDGEENEGGGATLTTTAEELLRFSCALHDVRGGALNRGASSAVVCSSLGLYVLRCAAEAADGVRMLSSSDQRDSAVSLWDCTQLGATTRGARFVAFTGVTEFVLLDDANHLLLLRCVGGNSDSSNSGSSGFHHSLAGAPSPAVELLADGHVLTRTARATALACSADSLDGAMVVVGFSNGQVRVIDARTLQGLRTLSVPMVSHPSAAPRLAGRQAQTRRHSSHSGHEARSVGGQVGEVAQRDSVPTDVTVPVLDVQAGAHLFTVCTPAAVYYYNKNTFSLQGELTRRFEPPLAPLGDSASTAAEVGLVFKAEPQGSWAYTGSLEGTLCYAPVCVDAQRGVDVREQADELEATDMIHARQPLPPAWTQTGTASAAKTAPSAQPTRRGSKTTSRLDSSRPLPPRAAKGSGYTDAPWSVQQERRKKAQVAAAKDRAAQEFGLPPVSQAASLPRFRYTDAIFSSSARFEEAAAPSAALRSVHQRTIVAMTFSTSGGALITGSSDGSAQHLQFPVARSKRTGGVVGHLLSGHGGAVTAVDANLSRQQALVLTSSVDGAVRLWSPGSQDTPVATCETAAAPASSRGTAGAASVGGGGVTCAQLFYLDKFVLSCSGSQLQLRRLATSPAASPALSTRGVAMSKAPVYHFSVGAGHTVTSLSGINYFASNVVALATSEKSVQLLDVVQDSVVWSNNTTHTRSIYRVALGRNSRHAAAMPTAAAHLLASAALDSTVALWDVRQRTPAQLYTQHTNTAVSSLGMELCPGSSMLAVAGQDQRVYVYDVRKGTGGGNEPTALHVLQDLDAYATSIAWHPLLPTLAMGLANGDVRLYNLNSV